MEPWHYGQLLWQLSKSNYRNPVTKADCPSPVSSEPPSWPQYPPFSRVGVVSRRQAGRRLGLDSWHRPCNDHFGLIVSTDHYWVFQQMDVPTQKETTHQISQERPTNKNRLMCTHHPSKGPFVANNLPNSSIRSHRRSQEPESLILWIGEGVDAGEESRWVLEMGRARKIHMFPGRRVKNSTRASSMVICVNVDGDDVWDGRSDERNKLDGREYTKKRTKSVNVNVAN